MPRKAAEKPTSNKLTKSHHDGEKKKTQRRKKVDPVVDDTVPEVPDVEEVPEVVTSKRQRRKKVDPVVDDTVSDVEDAVNSKRQVPTKESVLEEIDSVIESIDAEISSIRESSSKPKGVKFMRSLRKKAKALRGHAARVMKSKPKAQRKNNQNSGFLKPVPISTDMAKFTGWKSGEMHSRVQVTKYICDYIKEKNLQNPADRREIVPDKTLSKLLGYNGAETDGTLTYFKMQSLLKPHFPKAEKESA